MTSSPQTTCSVFTELHWLCVKLVKHFFIKICADTATNKMSNWVQSKSHQHWLHLATELTKMSTFVISAQRILTDIITARWTVWTGPVGTGWFNTPLPPNIKPSLCSLFTCYSIQSLTQPLNLGLNNSNCSSGRCECMCVSVCVSVCMCECGCVHSYVSMWLCLLSPFHVSVMVL